jgi:hypothetical protein
VTRVTVRAGDNRRAARALDARNGDLSKVDRALAQLHDTTGVNAIDRSYILRLKREKGMLA